MNNLCEEIVVVVRRRVRENGWVELKVKVRKVVGKESSGRLVEWEDESSF